MVRNKWRFLAIPLLFLFFVLAPLTLGAYWVRRRRDRCRGGPLRHADGAVDMRW